jgi:hypothetical protein
MREATRNTTPAMLMPNATDPFKADLLAQRDLRFIGHDGPGCKKGPDTRSGGKTPLLVSAPPFVRQVRDAGEKSFVLDSARIGIRKPKRGIFDLAVARYGLSQQPILYVGDDWDTDVEGGDGGDGVVIVRYPYTIPPKETVITIK